MGKITRNLSSFRNTIGVLQTTNNWIITVETSNSDLKTKLTGSKLEFRTETIEGCPPEIEQEEVEVLVGGFKIKFYGKANKGGELSFSAYESTSGQVGEFAREVMRIWARGASNIAKDDETTMLADSKYFKSEIPRFNITVNLADNAGNIKKTWKFFDAICKVSEEGELGQEAGAFKYKFTFLYTVVLEAKNESDDVW